MRPARKAGLAAATAAALSLCPPALNAQTSLGRLVETPAATGSLFGIQGHKLSYLDDKGTPNQPGTPFSESLPGNGTRAGYLLKHGGIIPSSLRVSVGARQLQPGVDYFVDAANGMLFFAEPVRRMDSVRASYRFIAGQDGARSPLGLQSMGLNLRGTALSLAFGLSSDPAKGLDFSTYGLSLNSRFASGSTLKGLLYLSTPAGTQRNAQHEVRASLGPGPAKPKAEDAVSDHLIVQDLSLKSGAARIRASYQDIGLKFSGFQAMRQAHAKDADVMAQIGALEKERGIRRLGFGAGLAAGKNPGLSFDWDRIEDGTDQILRQQMGFDAGGLKLSYGTQEVGEGFKRFNDLREDARGQWARERGVRREDLSLSLAAGKGSGLSFSQNTVGDKSGSLSRQQLSVAGNGLRFSMTSRMADEEFGRLNDLTDAEKTALALDIRRQFDPNAQAAAVTPKDKEQIAREAGLDRSQMSFQAALARDSAFAWNSFRIADGKGTIGRQSFSLTTKNLRFSYLDQRISEDFQRLGTLSDFERSQFANERGIHRNALGLALALSPVSSFTFNRLSLGERNGSLSRESFSYTTKGAAFALNFARTDKSFNRVADLAMPDPEKAAINAERGFSRWDLAAKITGIRGLALDTYTYRARNAEDDLSRDVYRYFAAWDAGKTTRLTLLSEGAAFRKAGEDQDARDHQLYTLDLQPGRGLKLSMYHDRLDTVARAVEKPSVTTDFLHLETDRSRANNLTAETKRVAMSDGRFENTTLVDANYAVDKGLALHVKKLEIDRGDEPSSDMDMLEWKWQVLKGLAFAGMYAETRTNNDSDIVAQAFSLSGTLLPNLALAGTYTEIAQEGKPLKVSADVALSNPRPVNMGILKETSITARYGAVHDQGRKLSEAVSGKVATTVAKNQVAAEYTGMLDPKGGKAINRTLSLQTDPNPKRPLKAAILYRARNIRDDKVRLVRKYDASLRLGPRTQVAYACSSLPEDPAGNMLPVKSKSFKLVQAVNKGMSLGLDYTVQEDMARNTLVSRLGGVVNGKLDALTAVEVGYSVDVHSQGENRTDAHTLRLGYDHQVNGDNFLTVSTVYTMFRGDRPDDLLANLDFKTRF